MRTEKTLILGGAGFLGSHITRRLFIDSTPVRILTRSKHSLQSLGTLANQVEICFGDFADELVLRTALSGVDTVVHLISSIGPSSPISDGLKELQSTILPTARLLECCANAGIRKLVYVSSGGTVYGNALSTPILEDTPLEPLSVYGHSKKITESYIRFYAERYNIDASILRLSNPFGPGQDPSRRQGIVAVALQSLKDDTVFDIVGDGSAIRDYIYVADAAEGIVRALRTDAVGTVNISSGSGLSVLEILAQVESVTGLRLNRRYLPARKTDVASSILSNALAQSRLGWSPTTEIEAGIARTWTWFQEQQMAKNVNPSHVDDLHLVPRT